MPKSKSASHSGQREGYVTVRLRKEVHDKLLEIGWKDETFSDIIARLIQAAESSTKK